jgi:tRNA (uracil-5-)-methyltransferase TRM9
VLHLSPSPPYSRFMLYVWAFEQGHDSRRRMGAQAGKRTDKSADKPGSDQQDLGGVDEHASGREAGQRVGVDVPGDVPVEVPDVPDVRVQDVLVPWVMQSRGESSTSASRAKSSSTSTSAPAPAPALASASSSARQGAATTETHNSPPLLDAEEGANRAGDAGLEAGENARPTAEQPPPKEEQEHQVFHRYYHLFLQGELRELVEQAAREEGFVLKPARAEGGGEGEGEGGRGRGGKRSGDGPREYLSAERRTRGDAAKWLRVVGVGWEADNWWLEGEVGVQSSV